MGKKRQHIVIYINCVMIWLVFPLFFKACLEQECAYLMKPRFECVSFARKPRDPWQTASWPLNGTREQMNLWTMCKLIGRKASVFHEASFHICSKHVLFCVQVMGVVGPSSVADGLPLLHLSPYLSPPLPFSTAVVRLVALQIQVGFFRPHGKLIYCLRVGRTSDRPV